MNIKSDNIRVYPTAFRGSTEKTDGTKVMYDPCAILSTESNLTRAFMMLIRNKNGGKGSAVITDVYDARKVFEFFLHGYYFQIIKPIEVFTDSTKSYYAHIKLKLKGNEDDNKSFYLDQLASMSPNVTEDTLDGTDNYFYGLEIDNNATITGAYNLLLLKNGVIPEQSKMTTLLTDIDGGGTDGKNIGEYFNAKEIHAKNIESENIESNIITAANKITSNGTITAIGIIQSTELIKSPQIQSNVTYTKTICNNQDHSGIVIANEVEGSAGKSEISLNTNVAEISANANSSLIHVGADNISATKGSMKAELKGDQFVINYGDSNYFKISQGQGYHFVSIGNGSSNILINAGSNYNLYPSVSNATNLGIGDKKWKCLYTVDTNTEQLHIVSDKRLKENIEIYTCDKSILDLPIYEFDYKDSKKHSIGCMAQDLQEICPEIVHEDINGYLSIEENKLVYLLLDEVKKLKKEIDELKASR